MFEKVSFDNAIGSSFKGYLTTSYDNLVKNFGEPTSLEVSGDGKVRAEWALKFDNGTIATIYDWKSQPDVELEDITDWHIGGFDYMAVTRLEDYMTGEFKITHQRFN